MADNSRSLLDGDRTASDWIEIHNPNDSPLDLGGHFLTDDAANPAKWPFPAGTILPPDGYLVVFASSQAVTDYLDPQGNL
ncbi:MAG: lamin tail domain-containing protein, partial [Akkermansiaceae bacterium]|nr:lamin tail domain-containing protein [Akkermansiaceae bacterium]